MNDRPVGAGRNCQEFLETLEEFEVPSSGVSTAMQWLAELPEKARAHAANCASCGAALEDFVETRVALARMRPALPEPPPWFAARVMTTIRSRENEMEEQRNGVWISVRRLAPRLAAFAGVVLVLGGTWAMELRRSDQRQQQELRQMEGLFETAPSTPLNDDILPGTYEERQP